MDWRKLEPDDFDAAVQIHPEILGHDVLSAWQARGFWQRLLTAPGFQGVAVMAGAPDAPSSIAGIGASVFISESFACDEVSHPRPRLNDRIITEIAANKGMVFSRSKIEAENTAGGLNVVVLAGRWNTRLTDHLEIEEVRLHLATSFARFHDGFRFKRVLIELSSPEDRRFAEAVPFMRIHSELGQQRALAVIEKSDVQSNQGSILAPHFACPSPALFLRPGEQELLLAALDGATDKELAERLGLTKQAVKRRWMAVFDQVEYAAPGFFPHTEGGRTGRGPQRRHLVLAYVRKHPEELRPFARPKTATA